MIRKKIAKMIENGLENDANKTAAIFLKDLIDKSRQNQISNYDVVDKVNELFIELDPQVKNHLSDGIQDSMFYLWELHDVKDTETELRSKKLDCAEAALAEYFYQ